MKLLLDTHIWLWGVLEPERIGRRTLRALASTSNQLWLSPISIWEVGSLADANQIDLGASPSEWVRRTLDQHPLHDAAFTCEVAIESRAVQLAHRDPADRLLAATARVYDLTLVTADEHMLVGKGFRVLRNR
jgi:PIN domain nuclease of toxin-antitoxin system